MFSTIPTIEESVDSPSMPCPIQESPGEILLIIFNLYLADDPRLVRRLMLVCKRWYFIIINTPQIWTYISFKIPWWYPDDASYPTSLSPKHQFETTTMPFIRACLKHVGLSLLHIHADFRHLQTDEGYDWTLNFENLYRIQRDEETFVSSNYSGNSIAQHISSARRQEYDIEDYVSIEDAEQVFRLLTGEHGSRMHQWATLALTFPDLDDESPNSVFHLNYLHMRILNKLTGATPNLYRLEIQGLRDEWDYPESEDSFIPRNIAIFPDLSSLRYLDLNDALELSCFLLAPITHLRLRRFNNQDDLLPFLRIPTLQTLTLRDNNNDKMIVRKSCHPSIHTLELEGTFHRNLISELEFPSLKLLRFILRSSLVHQTLPICQPERIEVDPWNFIEQSKSGTFEPRRFLPMCFITYLIA